MQPEVRGSAATDLQPEVRGSAATDLQPAAQIAEETLRQGDRDWKRRAALAFAERGDVRGAPELVGWWAESTSASKGNEVAIEFERAKEILEALTKLRARSAVASLTRSLGDVRLRPFIADALAAIGDPSAKGPLLAALTHERYVPTRPHLARALLALGAREELRGPLARFAGLPDPMLEAVAMAYAAKILDEAHGGWAKSTPSHHVAVTLTGPREAAPSLPSRLLVLVGNEGDSVQGTVDGVPISVSGDGAVRVLELGSMPSLGHAGRTVEVALDSPGGIRALWLLPHREEIEPPPPEPWDAGSVDPTLSEQ